MLKKAMLKREKARELIRARLNWHIEIQWMNNKKYEIKSLPHEKKHIISLPDDTFLCPIAVIHEIAHGWITENIHPLIGSAPITCDIDEIGADNFETIGFSINIITDWFADFLVISTDRDRYIKDVAEFFEKYSD